MKTCMLMNFKSKYTVNVICLFHCKYEAVSIRMYFLSILRNLFNLSIAFEQSFALSSTSFQYYVHIESTYWYNLNDIIETCKRYKPETILPVKNIGSKQYNSSIRNCITLSKRVYLIFLTKLCLL